MSVAKKLAGGNGGRKVWIAGWALAAVILILGSGAAALGQEFSEPDNAMRLVRVRDLLAGQGWFDAVQHRLNPPDGTPMHWARWIDAAIAGPILLLAPLVGQHNAEIAAAFVWPFSPARRLHDAGGAGVRRDRRARWPAARSAMGRRDPCGACVSRNRAKFAPGSFDHHNVEMILGLAAVLGLMRMEQTPRAAGCAGLALGAAMATAAEGVPMVAAGLVVTGILWLARPDAFARGLAWLGAGLGFSSVVFFLTMVPSPEWSRPVCDAMSTPFLGLGLAGGIVALVLGAGAPRSLTSTLARRVGLAALLGSAALFALVVLFPDCLGGGYSALGADMERLWMSQISETRSLFASARETIPR